MAIAVLLIFFVQTLNWIEAEVFKEDVCSATVDIASLTKTHKYITERIELYLIEENYRLNILKQHLNSFEREHKKMENDEDYVGNPINAFTLIFSLTEQLKAIQYYLKANCAEDFIKKPVGGVKFPLKEDLKGAAVGLWRLQKTYNLNVTSLAAGKLQGTYSYGNRLYEEETSPMPLGAILEVGRVVYEEQDYNSSLAWFFEALRIYHRLAPEELYSYGEAVIVDYIRFSYEGICDFANAIKWTAKLMELTPERDDLFESMVYYHNKLENPSVDCVSAEMGNLEKYMEIEYFPGLCRGEIPMPENKKKHLHCFYKIGPHPFLRLAPSKTELLHLEPDVYIIYDMITDGEIEHIRHMAEPVLKRAGVIENVGNTFENGISSGRTSKSAWLNDVDSQVVARLSRRLATFADLNADTAEDLQVGNYGIGGYFAPHADFLNMSENIDHGAHFTKYGNRFATIMLYMSEVEQGGATVFTKLKLTVFPVKNAAIMWNNLLSSGEPDFRTVHGGCPVLRGSKWVSNKWFHEVGQELIKKCGLEYERKVSRSDIFLENIS